VASCVAFSPRAEDEVAFQALMKKTVAATKVEGLAEDVGELTKLATGLQSMKFASSDDPWSFESDMAQDHATRSASTFVAKTKARVDACLKTFAEREEGIYERLDKKLVSRVKKKHKAAEKAEKKKIKPRRTAEALFRKLKPEVDKFDKWLETQLGGYSGTLKSEG